LSRGGDTIVGFSIKNTGRCQTSSSPVTKPVFALSSDALCLQWGAVQLIFNCFSHKTTSTFSFERVQQLVNSSIAIGYQLTHDSMCSKSGSRLLAPCTSPCLWKCIRWLHRPGIKVQFDNTHSNVQKQKLTSVPHSIFHNQHWLLARMAINLPQNLSLAVTTNITSTAPPLSMIQSPQWDPASVYGVVFGILTIVLAIPSTMLAFYAIKAHRRHQDEENSASSCKLERLNPDTSFY